MLIGSIACFILLILFFAFFVDLKKVHAWTAGINPWAVFALLVFLPLVGFPVSVLFVVTGAKFGSFGGIGVVAHTPDKLALNNTRFAGGGGFRFMLDKKQRINLRMEYAWGNNSNGAYLTIGEAF